MRTTISCPFCLGGPNDWKELLPNCDWEYLLSLNEGLGIGLLVGILNHSQLVPSAKPAGFSIVENARPGREGLTSRANRAASGPNWEVARWAIPIQPYAPG
jgi:hypothetical protein